MTKCSNCETTLETPLDEYGDPRAVLCRNCWFDSLENTLVMDQQINDQIQDLENELEDARKELEDLERETFHVEHHIFAMEAKLSDLKSATKPRTKDNQPKIDNIGYLSPSPSPEAELDPPPSVFKRAVSLLRHWWGRI